MPFLALGKCEVCEGNVILLGLNVGKWILTIQFHFEKSPLTNGRDTSKTTYKP